MKDKHSWSNTCKSKALKSRVVQIQEEHLSQNMIFQQLKKVIQNQVWNWEKSS